MTFDHSRYSESSDGAKESVCVCVCCGFRIVGVFSWKISLRPGNGGS